jgi:hypothetical protein
MSLTTMADVQPYEIPKACKAGVVINEGACFELGVEDVPVPEPGKYTWHQVMQLETNT